MELNKDELNKDELNKDELNKDELNKGELIRNLMKEFTENRLDLKKMIIDLEKLKANIDKLFPDTLDARYMRYFEEKVKSATELFKAILDVRKEISKNIKIEIDIINKSDLGNEDDEIELTSQELAKLATQVENYKKEKNKNSKIRSI